MSKIIKTPSNSPIMGRINTLVNELCPEGVEYVKLGDVCSAVFAGGTPSTSRDDYYDGTIPWIRSGEIDFNRIFNAERNITDLGLANSSAKMIKPFSVVMAMTGATVAKVATVEIETSANQSVCALEINKDMDYRYLYYYLSAHYHDIKSSAQGALTSLNIQMIKALQIPLPPLSIQQEIVSVLDSFTTLIDKMKQEVEKRKKQMEYYREKLLTFEENDVEVEIKPLAEVCEIKNGYTPSKSNSNYWENGTMPWFRLDDIRQNGRILKDAIQHITQEAVKRGIPFKASSVIVSTTATIGEHAFIEVPFVCNQQITVLTPNNSLLPKFLYYLGYSIGQWCKANVNGAGLAIIPTSRVGDCTIPIPSRERQSDIVSTLDKFESYITKLEKMIVLRQKQYEYYREQLLTFRPSPSLP